MPSRFEIDYSDPALVFDPLVDEVFAELTSDFLVMPRGGGFVDYPTFERGYQALKSATTAFTNVSPATVEAAVLSTPISFVVFRTILGLTAPEWADVTAKATGVIVDQGAARDVDRRFRLSSAPIKAFGSSKRDIGIRAMIAAGVGLLIAGASDQLDASIHRLDKADTRFGLKSLQPLANLGVPYALHLYERFLGRPFATHRDSVSGLVGQVVESAIKDVLTAAKVSFRETKRAEHINGFDQAPDFIIPDEFSPVALIEAKVTEDDGTARDKVSRVQRLRSWRDENRKHYDVIACIAGRGFKVRREDMRRLLQATDGKVFTLATVHLLVDHTRIREYRVR